MQRIEVPDQVDALLKRLAVGVKVGLKVFIQNEVETPRGAADDFRRPRRGEFGQGQPPVR